MIYFTPDCVNTTHLLLNLRPLDAQRCFISLGVHVITVNYLLDCEQSNHVIAQAISDHYSQSIKMTSSDSVVPYSPSYGTLPLDSFKESRKTATVPSSVINLLNTMLGGANKH